MKRAWMLLLTLLLVMTMGLAAAEEGKIESEYEEMIVSVNKMLTAKYSMSPAALRKGGVSYKISDESIATVNYKGQVKGVAPGECTLTITSKKDPSVKTEVPVTVIKPVTKITLTVPTKKLNNGDTMQIEYACSPEDSTVKGVTFSSSKESVATVDENGLVTAIARGAVTITVKSADGKATSKLELTVAQKPEEIKFKQEEYTMAVGRKLKFSTTVLPGNANNKSRTWEVSDASIARIDKEGTLTAKAEGVVIVTCASAADPSVSASVVVNCVNPISTIAFDAASYDIKPGETLQLEPVITPDNATRSAVEYRAVNPYVCSVDKNGLVTGLTGGITEVVVVSKQNDNRTARVGIRVVVPAESVRIDEKGIRIPVGEHAFVTAKIRPEGANTTEMDWVSTDPTVAVVTNATNRPRIEALKWGRVTLTGTMRYGGFTASINVNVGALHEAVTVSSVKRSEGQLFVTLNNPSDMRISAVTLAVAGTDANGNEVEQNVKLDVALAPGTVSEAIAVPVESLRSPSAAVAIWETDTGYYNNNDELKYSYRIAGGLQVWKSAK